MSSEPVHGMFDFCPSEETAPIWITNHLVTLFGEMPPPPKEGIVSLRLLKHELFGTGGHPASRIAIWRLLGVPNYDDPVPTPFIELGATTGLLALVAAISGTEHTYQGSNSVESAALAEDNGVLNGFEIRSEPLAMSLDPDDRAEFYECVATQVGGSTILRQFIPEIYASMKPGGYLLWAGHTATHHQGIKAQLEEFFKVELVDDFMGWPVIVLRKAKTT